MVSPAISHRTPRNYYTRVPKWKRVLRSFNAPPKIQEWNANCGRYHTKLKRKKKQQKNSKQKNKKHKPDSFLWSLWVIKTSFYTRICGSNGDSSGDRGDSRTAMMAKRHWEKVALTAFVQTWIFEESLQIFKENLRIVSEIFQNKTAGHQTDRAFPGAMLLICITRKSINVNW